MAKRAWYTQKVMAKRDFLEKMGRVLRLAITKPGCF